MYLRTDLSSVRDEGNANKGVAFHSSDPFFFLFVDQSGVPVTVAEEDQV